MCTETPYKKKKLLILTFLIRVEYPEYLYPHLTYTGCSTSNGWGEHLSDLLEYKDFSRYTNVPEVWTETWLQIQPQFIKVNMTVLDYSFISSDCNAHLLYKPDLLVSYSHLLYEPDLLNRFTVFTVFPLRCFLPKCQQIFYHSLNWVVCRVSLLSWYIWVLLHSNKVYLVLRVDISGILPVKVKSFCRLK